jgi:RNA polymerase sigma factor (sigma-70 family)
MFVETPVSSLSELRQERHIMDVAPDEARKGSNSVTTNMTLLRSEKKSSLFEFASGITCRRTPKAELPHALSMKKDWQLTQEDFNRFLNWLDPDRDKAAQMYEKMRRNLILLLNKRGCHLSEDLADESFNRVISRLPKMIDSYTGSPAAYIVTVAKNLYLEYAAERSRKDSLPESDHTDIITQKQNNSGGAEEKAFECLDRCLDKLPPESRKLILDYYRENRRVKIDNRKKIAEDWGLSFNALRIRVHRVREILRQCMDECLASETTA